MASWSEFAASAGERVVDAPAGSATGAEGGLMRVEAWSDGSSRGNPGPGGYGAVLRYTGPDGRAYERELSAGYRRTTNNRMELMGAIAALEALFEAQGDSICAVMLEPIQGESGVHPCSSEFMAAVRRLTAERHALMICDEVQCGIYRTGKPFGFQNYDVVPDIVSIAKGVASGFPCGMCAARGEVAAAFKPGDHGSTFGGSNLAVAAAEATLSEIQKENLAANAIEVGAYLREQLSALPQVTEVRGMGLMLAADLAEDGKGAPDVVLDGLSAGLLLNATGAHTLRFLPPLVCSGADVDALIEKLGGIL